MNERDGQIAVYNWRRCIQPFPMVICNLSMPGWHWEADAVYVTRSGYWYEFEVKVTRSDFFADSKKRYKHTLLADPLNKRGPTMFYYVCPADMVTVDEVPEYAGLAYIVPNYYDDFPTLKIVKNPARRKVKKLDEDGWQTIAGKACDRFWSLSLHPNRPKRAIGISERRRDERLERFRL